MKVKSLLVLLAVSAIVAAGCSSSSKTASSTPTSTSTSAPGTATTAIASTIGTYTRPACAPKQITPTVATRVAGTTSDYDLTSFDGTALRIHWFPKRLPPGLGAPTVLKGPGWGQAGDTNTTTSSFGLFGDLSIESLNNAGYNVLTWDPRGFGKSGGTVESDSPDFEGRDVERMIDWVSEQPGVQLDGPGDPRMGMVGASYGGGIQLIAAAIDCRIDAIVPQIAWHSLSTSLFESATVKQGWGDLLYKVSATHKVDPHITSAHTDGDATGVITADDAKWFEDRGPGDLVGKITAPTLFEQGTIDTLFPLDEAVVNFDILQAKGVPTAMLWMCSGHGVCLTNPGDQNLPGTDTLAWLDRYVQQNVKTPLGAKFEYVDQNGVEYTAPEFPPRGSVPITVTGRGTLTLDDSGGSGPAHPTGSAGVLGALAAPITPAKAEHAANIPITIPSATNIVGAPQLTLEYSGTSPAGTAPTRVFAQLVDDKTGIVLGNQITPIEITLDGKPQTTTLPLEMVAFTATAGAHLTLQLVATTTAYAKPRLGGTIDFTSVKIDLPTVTEVTRQTAQSPAAEVR